MRVIRSLPPSALITRSVALAQVAHLSKSTWAHVCIAFALLAPLAVAPARPAAAQAQAAYRLVDVLWQQTGTGPSRGLNTVQWLQQPAAQGGRVEIKVINPNNLGCAEKEQTFQLGWSFDQNIQTVAYGQSFRMLPSVAKTTPGASCYDAYYLAAGDQNGMNSPLRQQRDIGTGPGGVFFAADGYDRVYAPARPNQPQATRFTVSDRDKPRRAFFHMNIEAWFDIEINVVYVYEQVTAPSPTPVPQPPATGGDYRLIDVLFLESGTGPSRGLNVVRWLQQPSASGGRLEVKVVNPNNLGCTEREQTFTLDWSFDQDIRMVSFGQSFRLVPALSKSTPAPSCYDAYYLPAGDQNGMVSPLLQQRDQGTGPGGVFFVTEGYDRMYAPPRPGQPQGARFTVSDRDKPRRAFFHMDIETWFDVQINVVYLYERVEAQPLPQPASGPIAWWPANGNPNDVVGGYTGTLVNGASFGEGGDVSYGQSFAFDGYDDFITAGNPTGLQRRGGDFTVMAWTNVASLFAPPDAAAPVCIADVGCDLPIVNKMVASTAGANTDGWRLLKQADNRFWFCLGAPSNGCTPTGPTTVQSATVAEPGIWYHVAAVRSAGGIALYVNGSLEATASPGSATDTDAGEFLIGHYPAESFMYGRIDDVKLYDRALSEPEIQAAAQR